MSQAANANIDSPENAHSMLQERNKSWMLRAWILSGLFFMALPGTLLGFSNLVAISAHHGLGSMPAAWMEGHGHAQMFGWIGSFILGIGFYSQPTRMGRGLQITAACLALWTSGVLLRWLANIYEWHWRAFLPLSSAFELIAIALFLSAASRHKRTPAEGAKKSMEPWMVSVLLSTAGLTAAVVFNFVECVRLALHGTTPSFPHGIDQRYLVLLGWGFLAPVVWGFSARWLPAFLGLAPVRVRVLQAALLLDLSGLGFGLAGLLRIATIFLSVATLTAVVALRMAERPVGQAKIMGVHASFPVFARISYVWLVVAGCMSVWAAIADRHSGIWGASRHALTVGFAATMVFAIGPRILPHFCGIARIFSRRLMFACLLLLQIGCTLRVASEPLAYEGFSNFAWQVLPVSGMVELTAVLIFATNMTATLVFGPPAFMYPQSERTAA